MLLLKKHCLLIVVLLKGTVGAGQLRVVLRKFVNVLLLALEIVVSFLVLF